MSDLAKAVGEHLPWVPDWLEGRYRPNDDELRLLWHLTYKIVLARAERVEHRARVIERIVWWGMVIGFSTVVILLTAVSG